MSCVIEAVGFFFLFFVERKHFAPNTQHIFTIYQIIQHAEDIISRICHIPTLIHTGSALREQEKKKISIAKITITPERRARDQAIK